MSLGLTITAEDGVRPAAEAVAAAFTREDVRKVMARAFQTSFQAHFRGLDSARANKMGGRRTHFYGDAARGTQAKAVDGGIAISINKTGIAQRYFGGTIKPTNSGGWLTIPARSEAYGKRAREFSNLRFVPFANGTAALVENDSTRIAPKRGGGFRALGERGGGVVYWLKREVIQREDKTVLPEMDEASRPAITAASEFLQRQWEAKGGKS